MIGIILFLIPMLIIALLDCLIRKDLRHSLIFAFPIIILIGIYVWLFTLLPVQWGLKKMPFIEMVQIREVSENDYQDSTIYSGIIEFMSDKELNDYNLIVMKGSSIKNLSYNDFINNDSLSVFTSYDAEFVTKVNDRFLYKTLFVTEQSNGKNINENIYCKVFLIRMFAPTYETNEIVIPYNKLFQIKE